MAKIVINGEAFEPTNDPSHGIVRQLRRMQKNQTAELLNRYRGEMKFDPGETIDIAIQRVVVAHPEEMTNLAMRNEEFNLIATISMAIGKVIAFEDLETIKENELNQIFEECVKILGGDANHFFSKYGRATSSKMS